MNGYMITNDGTINFVHDGKSYSVASTHTNYQKVLTAIRGRKYRVAVKLATSEGVQKAIQKLSSKVTVKDGQVLFEGQPVGGVVVERILRFVRAGLPHKPLVRFLERLQQNPSNRSVQELYKFLEHENMPLTDDGCFIGYKAIRNDWTDKHTGTFSNKIGSTPSVPRNTVCDDFNVGCGVGLHVGSYAYANGFAGDGDRIVLVKVDPADAVSVPSDSNYQKLRVWRYRVMEEVARDAAPLAGETFGDVAAEPVEAVQDDDFEDEIVEAEADEDCP